MHNTIRTALLPITFALLTSSCTTRIDITTELPAINTADELLDEWGAITSSAPIISIPADEYEFKIDKSSQQYYESAKTEVNAGILQHTKTVFSFLMAASEQADASTKALYDNQLSNYQSAVKKIEAGQQLTEEEKALAKAEKQALLAGLYDAAKLNYEKCVDVADKEGEKVSGDISVENAIALNNAEVDRRKTCLNDYQAELAELSAVSGLPDFPELTDKNVPELTRIQSTPFGSKSDINSEAFALNNDGLSQSFTLPDYNALPQAATNKFLADMLNTISNNEDEKAYFGVTMVSVNPGWRTRKGYHAVINLDSYVRFDNATLSVVKKYIDNQNVDENLRNIIRFHYFGGCLGEMVNRNEKRNNDPGCAEVSADISNLASEYEISDYRDLYNRTFNINATAISPVTYAQTQELQNRQISQVNLSLMLAASLQNAGLKESAEIFADYSKQRRQEFGSRSSDNNVSVFSTGSMIGLEIQPEFFAATFDGNDPVELLQQQTFPVLVRFDTIGDGDFKYPYVAKDCKDKDDNIIRDYCLMEPTIYITRTSRWKSSTRSPWLLNKKIQLNTESLYNLKTSLEVECKKHWGDDFIHPKCSELQSKLFETTSAVVIPQKEASKPAPSFQRVFPSQLTLKRNDTGKPIAADTEFVFIGENFSSLLVENSKDITKKVNSVYDGIAIKSAEVNGNTLTVKTTITDAKGPAIFVIDLGDRAISTAMSKDSLVSLNIAPVKPPKKIDNSTSINIDIGKDQSIKVTLPEGVDDLPEHVREVIMTFYQKPANLFVPQSLKPISE